MSALAGPGDLAGSLGEMAEEERHLLGVLDAGMLAATFLGWEALLLLSMELLPLRPASVAGPALVCVPLSVPHRGVCRFGASGR